MMQQIFNILSLIPGYLIFLAIILVILPTAIAVLLRLFLYGHLKRLAVKLSKIANDLRLLSSGPRGGLNDINLPAVQPGSSMYVPPIEPLQR